MNLELNDETFLLYAIKHYDNPHCLGMKEFLDDLKTFKYLTRLFRRYTKKNVLKERLIINHLVIFYNVFEFNAATNMLFYKIDEEFWPILKTFLIFLGYLSHDTKKIGDVDVIAIPVDMDIANVLRKI